MKRLIFVRHGKAEELVSGISDFERSLTAKGKILSRSIARKLREKGNSPSALITSPAFRALETAIIFATELNIEPEKIILDNNLYHKMNLKYLAEILAQHGEKNNTLILFGHNPAFTEIADSLSPEGCTFMPKSSAVCISFDVRTWQEIRQTKGRQEFFLKPEKDI